MYLNAIKLGARAHHRRADAVRIKRRPGAARRTAFATTGPLIALGVRWRAQPIVTLVEHRATSTHRN